METESRALLVYQSMFGTRQVAEPVAAGPSAQLRVELGDVASEPVADTADWDLIAAGAPTHTFSLSRPSTRAGAIDQGATGGSVKSGMREPTPLAPGGR